MPIILTNKILFRVFLGGKTSNQSQIFTNVMGLIRTEYDQDVIFETIDVDQIKIRQFSPENMIDWLLGTELVDQGIDVIFIILAHLHQVIYKYTSISIYYKWLMGTISIVVCIVVSDTLLDCMIFTNLMGLFRTGASLFDVRNTIFIPYIK
jgi:hypothetical protein